MNSIEPLISKEMFLTLGHGDVIRWRNRFRTVLMGPADHGGKSITLPISVRSWTRRVTTTVGWSDCKHFVEWTGKRSLTVVSKDEIFRWINTGLSCSCGVRRELEDSIKWWHHSPERFNCFDRRWVKNVMKLVHDLEFAEL